MEPPSTPPAVTSSGPLFIRRVGFEIGGHRILSNISATLFPGELCGLIGPSGAGKSSLLKILLGLRPSSSGEVRLGGLPITDVGPVGYVPQDDALHLSLTVELALGYAARLRLSDADEKAREARVTEVLEQVGLTDRRELKIAKLSGGQRKRVSVAMELLTGPALLILDEPTSGLDPGLEAHLMALFRAVAGTSRVVVVATHSMESLHQCHLLLVMAQGYVAFFGKPADALTFFEVPTHAAIFKTLQKHKGAEWSSKYEGHPARAQFISRPTAAALVSSVVSA